MSRPKAEESTRGKRIELPAWWLAALNRRCGDRPRREIADELNARIARQQPFSLSAVYDFLAGKVTTDALMSAFLVLFPDLPPPIFYASSEEEAVRFKQLAEIYARPPGRSDIPKVAETIEDTGETTRTGEKRPRTGERTAKRTK